MRVSEAAVAAIKKFEGCRLTAYRCPAGVPTIGYGHTKTARMGTHITEAKADELLRQDLREVERFVTALGLPLSQGMFDALADFVFNLGAAKLQSSTLLRKINAGASIPEVQAEFRRWVYAGGKVLPGLVARRNWEAEQWAK